MTILIILGILLGGYLLATLVDAWTPLRLSPGQRGRLSLAGVLLFTAVGHFVRTAPMVEMLPAWVPLRLELVYLTGALEFLAALGLLSERSARLTGIALVIFFIAIFPANVYAAFQGGEMGGGEMGPLYLVIRTPLQVLLIVWCWWFVIRRQ